ncbi:MAG: hypothetical protein NZM94_01410 [Roseiflexus sp.]|nr:hypothetical protein [Roseiflexus sp.]
MTSTNLRRRDAVIAVQAAIILISAHLRLTRSHLSQLELQIRDAL